MSSKEALTKAKTAADKVKAVSENAVNKAAKLKNDFVTIPGFSKYERNSGGVIRNQKTGNIVNIEAWSGKYKITDDSGKNVRISAQDLADRVPQLKPKTAAVNKANRVKKENKKGVILELHNAGHDLKEIIKQTGYKPTTVYECVNTHTIKTLHAKGLSAKLIAEKTGKKEESIKSFIARNCK